MKTADSSARRIIRAAGLALLLSALPAYGASAAQPYERFVLSDADSERLGSAAYRRCIDASGGVTINMRNCAGAEQERLDARLNAVYRAAMARLPGRAAKIRLRNLERRWLASRWDACRREYAHETGTLGLILIDGCGLTEMKRRIAWLERYRR